jgi:hypothetical protein
MCFRITFMRDGKEEQGKERERDKIFWKSMPGQRAKRKVIVAPKLNTD